MPFLISAIYTFEETLESVPWDVKKAVVECGEGALDFLRGVIADGIVREHVVHFHVAELRAGFFATSSITRRTPSKDLSHQAPTGQTVTVGLGEARAHMRAGLLNGLPCKNLKMTLIHEVLHGLGMCDDAQGAGWNRLVETDPRDGTRWFVGSEAVKMYREHIGDKRLSGVPVENNFGRGTANSNWEEGGSDEGFSLKVGSYTMFGPERRFRYGVFHPALADDIMSGFSAGALRSEYFSKITAGALHDLGYEINWEGGGFIMNCPSRRKQTLSIARNLVHRVSNVCIVALRLYVETPIAGLFGSAASAAKKGTRSVLEACLWAISEEK